VIYGTDSVAVMNVSVVHIVNSEHRRTYKSKIYSIDSFLPKSKGVEGAQWVAEAKSQQDSKKESDVPAKTRV
jgi:hypothetical protein